MLPCLFSRTKARQFRSSLEVVLQQFGGSFVAVLFFAVRQTLSKKADSD